jgi:uncharacterized cupin superfamily protein
MKPAVRKPTKKEKQEAESWPIWEKEESTFPWEYDEPETCLILKGNAVVKTPEGSFEFCAGDYVVFPQGLKCTWEIKGKLKNTTSSGKKLNRKAELNR